MALTNDKQFQMRVSDEFLSIIDDWRRAQPDIPGRAEAVRRLVERGMQAGSQTSHQSQAAPESEPSLLSKFREFVVADAATDLPDGADLPLAIALAKKVAALPDDDLERALARLADDLTVREREKETARAAPKSRSRRP